MKMKGFLVNCGMISYPPYSSDVAPATFSIPKVTKNLKGISRCRDEEKDHLINPLPANVENMVSSK
jgi:hypothetical protein